MAGAYLSRRRQGSGETTHGVYPNPLIKKANPRGQTTSSGMHWEFQVFPQGSQQPTRLRGVLQTTARPQMTARRIQKSGAILNLSPRGQCPLKQESDKNHQSCGKTGLPTKTTGQKGSRADSAGDILAVQAYKSRRSDPQDHSVAGETGEFPGFSGCPA